MISSALVFALYTISSQMYPGYSEISSIKPAMKGEHVWIKGNVNEIVWNEDYVFMHMNDSTGNVKVIFWKDGIRAGRLRGSDIDRVYEGDMVYLRGEIDVYKGEPEIISRSGDVHII